MCRLMSGWGLGRVKTKSDLVVTPSGRQIFTFFCSPHDYRVQIFQVRLYRVAFSHSQGHKLLFRAKGQLRRSKWLPDADAAPLSRQSLLNCVVLSSDG
jgi:hypothetical protein